MADEKKVNVTTDEVEAAVEVDGLTDDARNDDALVDDEMSELFSAFADVSASDSLKESTLASILALADEAEPELGNEAESASEPADFKATPGGKADKTGKSSKSRRRAKLRAIRIGAIAACLALALGGGVAYAMPVSHAYVTQGDTTIDLGINRFGIAVAATADDEAGRELIDSLDLRNKPYEEALARTVEALGSKGTDPVQLNVAAGDDAQRKNLEEKGNAIVAEKCPSAAPPSQENEGAAPKNEPGESDQDGQSDQPAPGQADQAGRSAKPEQPDDSEDDDEPAMSSGSQPSGSQPSGSQPSGGQPSGGQSAQTDQPSQVDSSERQSRSAEPAEQTQRESSDQAEQVNEPSQPDQPDQPDQPNQNNRRGQGNQNESQSATNAEQPERQDPKDESSDVSDSRNDRDRSARNHSASDSDSEEDPEDETLTSESTSDE